MKRLMAFASICIFTLSVAAIPVTLAVVSFNIFDAEPRVPSVVWYVMLAAVLTFLVSLRLPNDKEPD